MGNPYRASGIQAEKQFLRKEMLARRGKLTTAQRVIRSADILQRLFELEPMRSASWVHFYVSYGSEVETTGMIANAIRSGKQVTVPKMDPIVNRLVLSELKDPVRELAPNDQGIPEPLPEAFRPVEPDRMDIMIVPGVGFDERGHRLGQGAGYYDRLLAAVSGKITIVGLAFDPQIVPDSPVGEHDVGVNWVITEKRVIECRP